MKTILAILTFVISSVAIADNKVIVVTTGGGDEAIVCTTQLTGAPPWKIHCSSPQVVKLKVDVSVSCPSLQTNGTEFAYTASNEGLVFLEMLSSQIPYFSYSLTTTNPSGFVRFEVTNHPSSSTSTTLVDFLGDTFCTPPSFTSPILFDTGYAVWQMKPVFESTETSVTLVEFVFTRQ